MDFNFKLLVRIFLIDKFNIDIKRMILPKGNPTSIPDALVHSRL